MLTEKYIDFYYLKKDKIKKRLEEFKNIPENEYFYEFCFCILTPQSSAKNAFRAVNLLKEKDFEGNPFNPVNILADKNNYIRFHNTKSQRLLDFRTLYPELISVLKSNISDKEKRLWIADNIKGTGMKESSHFLRNIGYEKLAILDRHILKNLVIAGVFDEIPNVGSRKIYLEAENKFSDFADECNIPMDELDLLFWSYETGEILK